MKNPPKSPTAIVTLGGLCVRTMRYYTTILLMLLLIGCSNQPQDSMSALRHELTALCDSIDAHIGVAVITAEGDTLTIGGEVQYPLLSVVKFPQALAVAHKLQAEGRSLDDTLSVTPAELPQGTWSPLRDEHPEGGTFTIGNLLSASLEASDNNACDILFHRICSVEETDSYIHSLGIGGCDIQCDEQMMRDDLKRCYLNASTPIAAARLLQYLYQHRNEPLVSDVWEAMARCQTGQHRIPAGISQPAATFVHKTGTGPLLHGRLIALNDVGLILYPDGTCFTLAVFIEDAALTTEQAEALIADITRIVTQAKTAPK